MNRSGRSWKCAVGTVMVMAACQVGPTDPEWLKVFSHRGESIHSFEIREFGFPFVPVAFGADTIWLTFDTGNMAGLTVESSVFARLGLPCSDRRNRLDSSGQVISTGCTAHGVEASVFGVVHDSTSVFEFSHESLSGLVGPDLLPGNRFTIDYARRVLAVDAQPGPEIAQGYFEVPLVRSPRHPLLILAYGHVNGHPVIFELDTGKSRTTIDRHLVSELGLEETAAGVRIGAVSLGPRTWTVSAARVVDTSGISEGLPARISLGVGSDVLAGFVFSVDYASGRLWIETDGS